jgi:DNA-nicking Smr family endonuclease
MLPEFIASSIRCIHNAPYATDARRANRHCLYFQRRKHDNARMPRRPKSLTEHDTAAWAAYAQTVRPLPGRSPPPAPAPAPAAAVPLPQPTPPPPRRAPPEARIETGVQPGGLDNATWAKFRGGRLAPARTLDLHGKTTQAAFHALEHFLHAAHADRVRCVEIITGRGAGGMGAIRRELPHWLGLPPLRPLILAAAHPHARNEGATRLLLRRTKVKR